MRLALLLLAAGCFGKPGFKQRDAAGDDDAVCTPSQPSAAGIVVDSATGPLATMLGNVAIGFADELSRYPMPDRLTVGGLDVVGPRAGCQFEDQIGVAVFPVYSIAAQVPLGTTHHLERLHVGPAFTALQTSWNYSLPTCPGGASVGTGNTVWSIFPDGKIVRNDTIVPTMTTDIMTTGCQCSGGGGVTNFIVTSYTAFRTQTLRALTFDNDGTESVTLPTAGVYPSHRSACVTTTTSGRIAMMWDRVDNMDPVPAPTRIRVSQITPTADNLTAFVYDMVPSTPAVTTLVHGTSYGIRTHMLLDAGTGDANCVAMQSTLTSFVNIQALSMDGATVAYSAQGVFDDQRAHAAPVMLSGTLPAGFTVRVRFPGFHAIRTSRAQDQVIWQVEGDGDFYVFFREALVSSITITPEC
jgi:hypothetical protein